MNFYTKAMVFGVAGFVFLAAGWFINDVVNIGNQEKYEVELKTKSDGTLEVKKNNQCDKKPHKGCLLFEQDTSGAIKFYLSGSRIRVKNCSQTDAVITKIELTTTADASVLDGSKGDFSVLPDSWLKDYAFQDLDLATGFVYEEGVNSARSQVWLINHNSHVGEREFWYKITATACGDSPTKWVTDPRGDNKGSSSR